MRSDRHELVEVWTPGIEPRVDLSRDTLLHGRRGSEDIYGDVRASKPRKLLYGRLRIVVTRESGKDGEEPVIPFEPGEAHRDGSSLCELPDIVILTIRRGSGRTQYKAGGYVTPTFLRPRPVKAEAVTIRERYPNRPKKHGCEATPCG